MTFFFAAGVNSACRRFALAIGLVCFPVATVLAQAAGPTGADLESVLRQRVAARPEDGSAWRLLGRYLLQHGKPQEGLDPLRRAVELEPLSAAAHLNLGRALQQLDRPNEAAAHYQRAAELAPESEYAREAEAELAALGDAGVLPVDYRIREFAGSNIDDLPGIIEPLPPPGFPRPLWARLETGALYNSNVALAPTSRNLFPGPRESFQLYLSPELEYSLLDDGLWRAGPVFLGYFALNEGNFEEFNLQSYQPGLFVERAFAENGLTLIPRLQYDFTHDEFDGETFGNRHRMTTSANALWDDGDVSTLYWSIEHTDFVDEGLLPAITSRDGWTNVVGASHTHFTDRRLLRAVRGGLDLQRTDTTGTDFSFNGISLFGEAEVPIVPTVDLVVEAGWGYRDYFDYEFAPSRNENIWRAGARLRKWFSESLWAALVFNYDRFDSRNRLFDAERFLTGAVLTYEY